MAGTMQAEPTRPHTPLAAAFARIERLARAVPGVEEARILLRQDSFDTAGPGITEDVPLCLPDGTRLGTLRLRHAAPLMAAQRAAIADLAAIAMDALDLQAEVATRQRELDQLALRERLLRLVADAPSLAQALDATMAALREATDSVLCLCFRIAQDGEHLQLVAGQASTPELTEAYLDHLRHTVVRIDNSLAGLVASSGEQQVIRAIDAAVQRRFPNISLSVRSGIKSQIITPVSLGPERFAFSVGFATERAELEDIAGMLLGLAGSLRPLLRRLHDAEEIALSEERLRLVARATGEVIWDWDLAEDRLSWGEGLEARFGHVLPPGPCETGWWEARIAPEDRDRVVATRRAVARSGDTLWSAEYQFRKADGGLALVADRGFVIRDPSGRSRRMVGSMLDITQRRQMEDQLRQSQRLDAIGRLTGGVAHDFNNLLAVIIGNAELLQEQPGLDAELRHGIDVIHAAAERGAELTSRLLSFARLHPIAPRSTDVNRLLAQMQPLLRRLFAAQIQLELVLPEAPLPVVIDGPQLENAILNLCINARDAMPEGGTLRIEARPVPAGNAAPPLPPGEHVAITVSDTGAGMSEEVAARAFEPFFTTKAFGKGSGLGLSMVFGFISQSNGHVTLASAPGQGTRVTLHLPRASEPAETEAQAPSQTASAAPASACILLVEDGPALRQTATAQLQRLGYEVLAAEDGDSALALLESRPGVDLLFTDIVMPGRLNGYQLARLATARQPGLRVLFTSGHHDQALTHHAGHDFAAPLLSKPYRFAELAEQVRKVLDAAS
ncbi:ATP-binding protein [Roseomonas sp. F4]